LHDPNPIFPVIIAKITGENNGCAHGLQKSIVSPDFSARETFLAYRFSP
jgi:hypothetical protein